jgi:pimeloyl-ACP methyl ester carboxylesterase
MRNKSILCLVLTIISVLCTTGYDITRHAESADKDRQELIEIETRPNVTWEFILTEPPNPVASAILLGGYGKYQIRSAFGKPTITGKAKAGFLIRSREHFAKHGLIVAVPNAPSDQPTEPMMPSFRLSDEHAQDMKALVSFLRNKANIPVWLIGMCKGGFSALNGCIQIKEGIDGIVLASCITVRQEHSGIPSSYPNGILSMDLDHITVPALIVCHGEDECSATPPSNAPQTKEALLNSPNVEVKYFTGGKPPVTKPCEALSAHGFYGIENQVVSAIAEFIKANSK